MAGEKENLNIDFHTRILVKEALRRYGSAKIASKYLEVTDRTVYRYMHKYNIDRNGNEIHTARG